MKRLRWQLTLIVLTMIAVTTVLVLQQPSVKVLVSQPESGGVYSEALIGQISRLNPLLDLNNEADRTVNRLLYSTLFYFDDRGFPRPDLAESWGVSPEGDIYNVTLRADARWHDGTPVTSDDVLFTIDLIRNGASLFPADVQ